MLSFRTAITPPSISPFSSSLNNGDLDSSCFAVFQNVNEGIVAFQSCKKNFRFADKLYQRRRMQDFRLPFLLIHPHTLSIPTAYTPTPTTPQASPQNIIRINVSISLPAVEHRHPSGRMMMFCPPRLIGWRACETATAGMGLLAPGPAVCQMGLRGYACYARLCRLCRRVEAILGVCGG